MGLQDIVSVIEHDFTAESVFQVLPKAGTVDAITMSYSYTMIPDKKAAMTNCTRLLKQNGFCAIADFFLHGTYDECLAPLFRLLRTMEAQFHKQWFAFDRVYLLGEEQLEYAQPGLEVMWDNRFRGAVPFLPWLQPYHGVYIMRKV
jgi:hypothetical protein